MPSMSQEKMYVGKQRNEGIQVLKIRDLKDNKYLSQRI